MERMIACRMSRRTVRLTSSSAVLAPKRRVRFLISTTGSAGAIMKSLLLGSRLHGLVALAHELNQFIRSDVHLASFRKQGIDAIGQNLQPFTTGQRRARVGNERSRGSPFDDEARGLQLTISPGNSVGI